MNQFLGRYAPLPAAQATVRLLALTLSLGIAAPCRAQQFAPEQLQIGTESKSALATDNAMPAKILVTDLSAPDQGHWFQGTPIAATNWMPLPAGRYIVRYRVAVDRVAAANVSLWGEVFARIGGETHRKAWKEWMGVDFKQPAAYQNLELAVDLPAAGEIQPRFLWRRSTKAPGDIQQIKLASLAVAPDPRPLVLSDALSDKVHYKEGEAGGGWAKVLNTTDAPQSGRLSALLFSDLDVRGAKVFEKDVAIPPRSESRFAFSFPALSKYGHELRVELRDAKGDRVVDARSDYFTVLNNCLEVGLETEPAFRSASGDGANGGDVYPLGHKGRPTDAWYRLMPIYAEAVRRGYGNTCEMFAWGPWDAIRLTPEGEDWMSGQTHYPGSVTRTKTFIDEFHKRGMTVQLYTQSLWGISSDYLQEHPDYFAYNAAGQPQGLDIHHPEPVDEDIAGLLKSIETFGWDGARWDGHFDYVPPYDNLKTLLGDPIDTSKRDLQVAQINGRIRTAINSKYPLFTWGYNWSDQVENFRDSKEIVSLCRGGSWILNESMKESEDPSSGTHKWIDYAERVASGNRIIRHFGGLYLAMKPPQYFAAGSQVLAGTILIYAARAYDYGGVFTDRIPRGDDLNAFMTRYARYLRGRDYESLPDASTIVSVVSPRQAWWKGYLAQKVAPSGVEYVLGMVNPPVTEAAVNQPDGQLPQWQQNIVVTVKAPVGMNHVRATLLSPDRQPFQQELPVALARGSASLTVPELRNWNVLHLEWTR